MKHMTLGIALLFACSAALAANDVWQTLFKEKLKEANQGNSNAQFDVGSMYQNGRGVSPDRSKAIEWYQKAAAQQNDKAISRLKLLQANEERFNKELTNAGNGNKESQYKLGNMYTEGVGTNIDLARAAQAYEESASQGYVKAEYKMGLIYYEGTGVTANKNTAFKWFSKAAEKNYPAAQYYLGKMYASGQGVKRNYTTALEWYTHAVDGGFNQARSEMIEVTEMMKAPTQAAAASESRQQAGAATKAAKAPAKMAATAKAAAAQQQAAANNSEPARDKSYGIEDLMVAAWSRNGKPVTYLPSAINSCRTENNKISCYSDDQTRKSANGTVRYKTKAIMRKFSRDGSFQVTYRNLVTNSTQTDSEAGGIANSEIGDDDDTGVSYAVQTGWGIEHVLECQMLEVNRVSCTKNNTNTFTLESPQAVASGH